MTAFSSVDPNVEKQTKEKDISSSGVTLLI